MIFTVVWIPDAEQRLADAWLQSSDRKAIVNSTNRIDKGLRIDPEKQGDLLFDTVRTMIVGVLGVHFEVVEEDRLVRILHVWDDSRQTSNPQVNGYAGHN